MTFGAPLRQRNRWFYSAKANVESTANLLVIPHSGGTVSYFAAWASMVPRDIEMTIVQLPGRFERRNEQPFTEMPPLIDALANEFADYHDGRPYAVFGHSLGALIAFRLAAALNGDVLLRPKLVALSAAVANPPATSRNADLESLSDEDLCAAVQSMRALPEGVIGAPEVLTQFMPGLRADLQVASNFSSRGEVISCPIVAYGGQLDPLTGTSGLDSWASTTEAFLGSRIFPGGHFYIDEYGPAVVGDVTRRLL